MITSKVSRKGLVNIPAKVRESLGIEEGDLLQWTIDTRSRTATIRVVKNPAEKLKAKYSDPRLAYSEVEGEADKAIEAMTHAHNRA